MKFADGYWMMRPGVRAHYPAQVHDVAIDARVLTLYAPTKPIRHRGDTLDGPLLTIRCSSPMPDVVRVRVSHFTGTAGRGPDFPLRIDGDADVAIADEGSSLSLTAGRLTVRIARDPWRMDLLADGKRVTESAPRGLGYVEVDGEGAYLHEQLSLGVGECVYGLGERFTALVKNGQTVDIWNRDGGTGSDQAYKNVPFYLTNRGYGVFVNHPGAVSFEVASEKVSRVQFSVPGEELEYFVIYGPTPKEVLERYTALTGRPPLPPAWSFGLWLTTSFTTNYDEETVTSFIQGMADRDLPLSVFHFDCFWMRAFHWCDFVWDPATFPDPVGMLRRLHDRGLRVCVWINPYIAQRSALFEEGKREGFLVRRPDGSVWQWDMWQAGMGIVDFTNPAACAWFADRLGALLDTGIDSFKTDFGERIPTDVVWHDGSDPERMHNFYAYLYNKVVFDVLRERLGEGEAAVFARAATAGCQQFPIHWGGDCYSSLESMAESLRGGLSLGLSGFGFWSHDIGGFEGMPPADIYKRWIAFGLLSSHSRLHGSSSYRVPWLFDEEAVDVLRLFTELKCRLMPYLFAAACEARDRGTPVMRAMVLEFPDDPGCDYLDRQYMLGDSLLVAPVFSADGVTDVYVPRGRWTHYLTGQTVEGPGWVRETYDVRSLPLLVRRNTLLPVGAQADRPDYDYKQNVTLQLYALDDGHEAVARVPDLRGEIVFSARVRRDGDQLVVATEGTAPGWRLQLIGVTAVSSVDGGTAEQDPEGALIMPISGVSRLAITL